MSLTLTYSGKSRPSAEAIMLASNGQIELNRGSVGDINWGRCYADTTLNADISNATNKRTMRELFAYYEVPAPELYDICQAQIAIMQGVELLGRPDTHSRRRGMWRCANTAQFIASTNGTRRKAAATHWMQWIDNAAHEYRVHVFQRRSIRISEKDFERQRPDGDYTMIRPTGDVSQVRTAAWKAVAALDLDFGAVDVLALEDGTPFVLEVNSAPGLGGSTPRVWAERFLQWWEER